ncbi:MAG: hypothetical protein AAGG09_06455 [Pseudomonadota bacterium]
MQTFPTRLETAYPAQRANTPPRIAPDVIEAHRKHERQARALVADPERAARAGAQSRRLAWAVLKAARGQHCIQIRIIEDARARGLS